MAPSSKCTNPKYLETLLEMCFQQFDDVVAAHSLLLKCLTKIKATYKGMHMHLYYNKILFFDLGDYELYSEIYVWTAIQHVVCIYTALVLLYLYNLLLHLLTL